MKGSGVYCKMRVVGFGWVLAATLIRLAIEVVADSSSYFTEYNSSPKVGNT